MNDDTPGQYLDQIRDIFIKAGVVQIEAANDLLGHRLDAAELEMLSTFRRLGWHAVRLDPVGAGAWVTLVHLTNERVGLQAFRHDGEAVAEEAWFTFDAAGVGGIATMLGTSE